MLGADVILYFMLTPKQKQVKDFLQKVIRKKGVAPSEREVARHFRVSASTAHGHLQTLKEKGHLQKTPRRARGIEIPEPHTKLIQIPLRGTIDARPMHEAIRYRETIAVPQSTLPFPNENYYALRVSGDNIAGEGIQDGDIMLVRKHATTKDRFYLAVLIKVGNYIRRISHTKQRQERIELIMPIQYAKKKCPFCEQKQDVDGRCPCVNKDAW